MKKGIRTRLVLFFVCAFMLLASASVICLTSVDTKAATLEEDAITTFLAEYADFNSVTTVDASILAETYHKDFYELKNAKQNVDKYGAMAKVEALEAGATAKYDAIYQQYQNAVKTQTDVLALIDDLIPAIADGSLRYSSYDRVKTIRDEYTALSVNEQAYVYTYTDDLYALVEVEGALATIKGNIDVANTAIAGIEAHDGSAMVAFDETNDAHVIVLDSATTIEAADTALKAIYGSLFAWDSQDATNEYAPFMSNWAKYVAAKEGFKAQTDKYEAVIKAINDLDANVVYGDEATVGTAGNIHTPGKEGLLIEELAPVYSTEKLISLLTEITAVRDAFNALDNVTYNDLQSKVENIAKLTNIETRKTEIDAEIANVVTLIEAIPAEAKLATATDKTYYDALEAANDAFELLSGDIIADPTYVSNYEVLKAAKDNYVNNLAKPVDDVVAELEAIMALGADEDFLKPYGIMNGKYLAFTAEQKTVVREIVMSNSLTFLTNYLEATAKFNEIDSKVANVILLINKMAEKPVAVDPDDADGFVVRYGKAAEAYNALTNDYNGIYNVYLGTAEQTFLDAQAEYAEMTKAIKDWKDAVNAIPEVGADAKVTANDFDLVKAADDKWDLLDATLQEAAKITESATYDRHQDAIAQRKAITDKVEAIVSAIESLPALPENTDKATATTFITDATSFQAAVTALDALFAELKDNALDNDDADSAFVNYFTAEGATYATQYEAYLAAVNNSKILTVELAIAKIYETDATIELADAAAIAAAKTAIEEYAGAETDIRNIQFYTDAKTALEALTTELDAWIAEVASLIGKETIENGVDYTADVDAVWGMSLTDIETLETSHTALATDADRIAYLLDAKTVLEAVKTRANTTVITEMETAIDGMNVEDKNDIVAVMGKYNDLDATQQTLVNSDKVETLLTAYYKVTFSDSFTKAVDSVYTEIINNGEKNLANYATAFALSAMYADSGLQGFIDQAVIDKLDLVIASYDAATVESSEIVEIKTAIAEIKDTLDNSTTDADLEKLANTVTELDAAYKAADAEIKGLIEALTSSTSAKDAEIEALIATKEAELSAAITAQVKALADGAVAVNTANIAQLTTDLAKAVEELRAEYKAADKLLNDQLVSNVETLQGNIDSLETTLTVIAIVFSVFIAATVAGVIVLFIKKKGSK